MQYDVTHRPSSALASVELEPGDDLTAQAGAMVTQTESIRMETGVGDADDGLLGSLKDSVLGGESFFRNRFTAEGKPGTVTLAPTLPGDVEVFELDDDALYLHSGAYLAAPSGVSLDTAVGGARSLFGGEGLFLLEATGTGPLFASSFGGLDAYEVEPGETFTVDSGHAVAWDADVEYATERVGGLTETLFSEEGLVLRFTGPGRVYVQTRNHDDFVAEIAERLPSGDGDDGGFRVGL